MIENIIYQSNVSNLCSVFRAPGRNNCSLGRWFIKCTSTFTSLDIWNKCYTR